MKIEDFAQTVLFSEKWEEKLLQPEVVLSETTPSPISIPLFPGRPQRLAHPGKARFPSLERLDRAELRGEILHFFANHELQAMELMALVLLRFPEAPPTFKLGLVRTIQEEQNHLRLYVERMKELGVDFGDLPVSDYFWRSMSQVRSPLDFVVQMSLTFEQANLDFSLFFKNAVTGVGDEKTAAILDRVYQEEIGHVKHGLIWFNRWRENPTQESDWDAYLRLLPHPMTPTRAKGFVYCADARRAAGFSEKYIQELGLFTGSKGRPPQVWIYNPHCDSEIARGKPGFTPSLGAKKISQDLQILPAFLASNQDLLLVEKRPSSSWLEEIQSCGFKPPVLAEDHSIRHQKIGGLQPWGWSPDIFETFQDLKSRLVPMSAGNSQWCEKILSCENFTQTGIGPLFSKAWSASFLKNWMQQNPNSQLAQTEIVGEAFTSWGEIVQFVKSHTPLMIKAPYGTSGMQVKKIQSIQELEGPIGGWIKKVLKSQGSMVVESFLNKIFDLSIQMEIDEKSVRLFEARQFQVGSRFEYRGAYLGKKFFGFDPECLRFFYSILDEWHRFARDLGAELRNQGYQGPAGIDAMIFRRSDQSLGFKPLSELNPRWTMGRVAVELERRLVPGAQAIWLFIPVREILKRGYSDIHSFVKELKEKHPVQADQWLQSGTVFTNDPSQVQEVLTVLGVLPHPILESFLQR